MVAIEKDSNADVPRDSMMMRDTGDVKTAQLEHTHQTLEKPVSHNQDVTDQDNTQEALVTAGPVVNAQMNQDGLLTYQELDVTDQKESAAAYLNSIESHGNVKDAH